VAGVKAERAARAMRAWRRCGRSARFAANEAFEQADVFAASDAPVLRALHLYRDEHVEDVQAIRRSRRADAQFEKPFKICGVCNIFRSPSRLQPQIVVVYPNRPDGQ
jgi:hypothetical protein